MEKNEDCILCRIIRGEIRSWKVYEDDSVLGILDIQPCTKGHCLVIPKKHEERFYEIGDEDLKNLFTAAKTIAQKIKKAYNPDYVCMFIRGGRLPHLHIALFPSMKDDPLSGFPQSSFEKTSVDLKEAAEKIYNIAP